jgi:hypothetical protein
LAAFRDTASASYPKEFGLATVTERKGRVGKEHVRKYIEITPYHIFMYKDSDLANLYENKDIIIQGQQPVNQVKGFSQFEVINGPIYFKFQMFFHPEGKFPSFEDKDLVSKCLYQATFRGLGGRRAANYGQWKILEARLLNFEMPFKILDGGKRDERDSIPVSPGKQSVLKTA